MRCRSALGPSFLTSRAELSVYTAGPVQVRRLSTSSATNLALNPRQQLDPLAQTRQIGCMHDRAWIIPLGLLVITSVAVPLRLIDTQCIPRYLELRAQLERTAHTNNQLQREIAALKHETELLKNDARAIERLARDELGMVREGEIVFQFPN